MEVLSTVGIRFRNCRELSCLNQDFLTLWKDAELGVLDRGVMRPLPAVFKTELPPTGRLSILSVGFATQDRRTYQVEQQAGPSVNSILELRPVQRNVPIRG